MREADRAFAIVSYSILEWRYPGAGWEIDRHNHGVRGIWFGVWPLQWEMWEMCRGSIEKKTER